MKPSERRIFYAVVAILLTACATLSMFIADIQSSYKDLLAAYEDLNLRVEALENPIFEDKTEFVEEQASESTTEEEITEAIAEVTIPAQTASDVVYSQIECKYKKTNDEKKAFGRAVYAIAKAREAESGVPAEVTTLIAICETGWGTSWNAVNKNNLFGLNGKTTYQSFDSPEGSFDKFYELMAGRYSKLVGSSVHCGHSASTCTGCWFHGLGFNGYYDGDGTNMAVIDEYLTLVKSVQRLCNRWGIFETD